MGSITGAGAGSDLGIVKSGFADAVLWNIGAAKAPSMTDLGAGEWCRYVCLESAIVSAPVTIAPGASWCGAQTLDTRGPSSAGAAGRPVCLLVTGGVALAAGILFRQFRRSGGRIEV